jgi:hypothetical protein
MGRASVSHEVMADGPYFDGKEIGLGVMNPERARSNQANRFVPLCAER